MNNRTFLLPLTIGAALALSACGGGGGASGSAPPNIDLTPTPSPISASNSPKAASNAYAANASLSDSSSSVTAALTGVSIEGVNISTVSPALDMINRAYNRGAPKLLTGVSFSESCSGGGTVSINGTVQNEQVASNGDTITFTTANCVEGGATLNGAFTISLSGISGTAFSVNAWGATIDVQFNAFSVASGSTAVAGSGDMKIVINQASSNSNSVAVSGKSFQTSVNSAGVNVASRTLTNYSAAGTTQGNTFTSAANFTMVGNTSALGQFAYTVKNLQPFVIIGGGTPTAGSFLVTGASSSVKMTVVDANSVRLEYSAKGDGVITETSTLGWASFLSSL
jgi:hypothetical protein